MSRLKGWAAEAGSGKSFLGVFKTKCVTWLHPPPTTISQHASILLHHQTLTSSKVNCRQRSGRYWQGIVTFEPESVTFIRRSISHGYGGCEWVMLWSADLPGDRKYTVGLIPKDTADTRLSGDGVESHCALLTQVWILKTHFSVGDLTEKRLQYQHYHILLIRDISLVPHFCIAHAHTGCFSCCCYGYKRFCKSLTKGFNQGWDVSIHLPHGNLHEGLTHCLIRLIHTCKHARAGSSYCEQKKQTLRDISALYLHQNNCWMCWDVFH